MRQIRVTQYGGPEQMRLVELPDRSRSRSRPRARRWCAYTVAGVNYMDIAARSMPLPGRGRQPP